MEDAIIPLAIFAAIAFVIHTLVDARLRRLHMKAAMDFNLRLLDRIGSIKEFNDFLQTEGGMKFMNSLTTSVPPKAASSPSHRILLASQIGTVLTVLGIGLLSLQGALAQSDEAVGFIITGVIALSIGVGFLVSAGVSFWLARQLNVLDARDANGRLRDAA
jgi:hypothetical protein